jgi:hypothetical protein
MNETRWIRDIHRWLSIGFTAAVIANVVALALKKQTVWVGLLALVPLILLLLTGLYLFVMPYLLRGRGGRLGDAKGHARA